MRRKRGTSDNLMDENGKMAEGGALRRLCDKNGRFGSLCFAGEVYT